MELIHKHFPELTAKQIAQLAALEGLYGDWNEKINVISRKDIGNLYTNHVLHSLAISKYLHFLPTDRVLDAGTGGGFPGLPLAILFPDTQFVLADSINKKLSVISSIAQEIDLPNVTTVHRRVEDLPEKFDFVVSRAVTRLDEMWRWTAPLIKEGKNRSPAGGLLYLKGGDVSAEIPNNCVVQIIPLRDLVDEGQFDEKALVHIHFKY